MSADLSFLLWGAAGVLIAATLLGMALRLLIAPDRSNTIIENLNARVLAWWAMTILLGLASLLGFFGILLLFAFASFAALREFLSLTTKDRADHLSLAAAFFIVLPAQYYLIGINWYGLYSIFIPVYVFLLLPMVSALRGNAHNYLIRIAETQWALMITVFCVSHIPALLNLEIEGFEGRNVLLIIFLVIVVQAADVLQYVFSNLFGGRKIAPAMSSVKTWEGLIGSALSGTILGMLLFWITPFNPIQAGLMALALSLLGFFGSLVMSAIKRDRGIKDWGPMMIGHGGFLDRMDSVIFAAPIFFHLTRFWWT